MPGAGRARAILGNGDNLLVSDRGLSGVVVAMEKTGITAVEGRIPGRARGPLLSKAASLALTYLRPGLEFAAEFPEPWRCDDERGRLRFGR